MAESTGSGSLSRRGFLAATGGMLAATPVVGSAASKIVEAPETLPAAPAAEKAMRKIPIGVFDPVYKHLSLDEMLEKISALGIEAVEIGTGGFPGSKHCPVAELLADPAALERHVRDNVQSAWHASCTCRMGDPADARTVVDPSGKVVGAENLFVADASVMPEVSRTNTNIPTIMIAERIAEMVRQRATA